MENFSIFEFGLGIVTGLPYGVILTMFVVFVVGKYDNKRDDRKGS